MIQDHLPVRHTPELQLQAREQEDFLVLRLFRRQYTDCAAQTRTLQTLKLRRRPPHTPVSKARATQASMVGAVRAVLIP